MDIEKLDINAVCFGILCNFTPVCGEEKAKEAVALIRSLQTENEKLQAEVERQRRSADNGQHLYENAERAYMKVLAELQKELCKHARGKENRAQIAEEIADVQIMLEQMELLHGCAGLVAGFKAQKLDRLEKRLREG